MTDSPRLAPSYRDGTSQAARVLPQLQPTSAWLDERSLRDLLAFAQAYARELGYFDVSDPDQPRGDWSGMLAPSMDMDAAQRYVDDPSSVGPDQAAAFSRPHVALLLAVLRLLGVAQTQLNALTRRHLEFFYGDVLRMTRKRAVPDRVHVLFELEPQTERLFVPSGTALAAGRDSTGLDLLYHTNGDLLASCVAVAQLRTVRSEVRVTGLREASQRYLTAGTRNDAFIDMLRMALGEPSSGDPLPVPIYPGVPPPRTSPAQPEPTISFDDLAQVASLLKALPDHLFMPSFDDFRLLMRLKAQREADDASDWAAINGVLAKAARARDANATFAPRDPTAFLTNLQAAIGKSASEYARLYDGLTEVTSIEDVYETYARRPDVAEFIRTTLFLSVEDFRTMMQTRLRLDGQWDEITRLLEAAGQRRRNDSTFRLPPEARAARDVAAKVTAALGAPDFRGTGNLAGYFAAFQAVERYFYMPAEHVAFVLEAAMGAIPPDADEGRWAAVYELVTAAHVEKMFARRRAALLAVVDSDIRAGSVVRAMATLLAAVLDLPRPTPSTQGAFLQDSWSRLPAYGVSASDLTYLQQVVAAGGASADWARVAAILDVAQRNREGVLAPVPRVVEWRNLYPARDARLVSAHAPSSSSTAARRWKTFGTGELRRAVDPVPEPTIGWAVASPLLQLNEGARAVDLTLGLASAHAPFDRRRLLALLAPSDPGSFTATLNPFIVEVSTDDGWTVPSTVALTWANPHMTGYPPTPGVDTSTLAALTFRLTCAEDLPPLVAPTADVHGLAAAAPVVRFMLRPRWAAADEAYVTAYSALRSLTVQRARLAVKVEGLKSLTMRNDQTPLDPKQPFEPFGMSPAAGARLYLGHAELVSKRLDGLVLRMTWKGVPSVLGPHYANYPSAPANDQYIARVFLNDRGLQRDVAPALVLFDAKDAAAPVARSLTPPADQGRCDGVEASAPDVRDWTRHFVVELGTPDFQHGVYPTLSLRKSLEMAAAVANGTPKPLDPAPYQVNAPVTPAIKSLWIDYSASTEHDLDRPADERTPLRVFHIEPFGYEELEPDGSHPGVLLLPQYDQEGELYIGLSGVVAPQTVSLLFQVAEGSANPDLVPAPIQWSVLSGNRWRTLHDGSLLADGTRGFVNSGIVELSLPAAAPSTLLPEDLYWIRASIEHSAESVCDMVDVHANAVQAIFADQGNAADHLAQPLPAGRITVTVGSLPAVATVRQPYSSFGGKMAEQDTSFYVRVSERLRHRERALTPWDYERLVLEKFPRLYKVKCVRADPATHLRSPGRIDVIVIPDIRNRMPFDPYEPKAPADVIRDIEAFLRDRTPASASVTVRNAQYVPVKVRCGVRFSTAGDESFWRRQLNEELNRFLSPWAYDEGADVVIGGKVYANSIINFMERREYVDYVAEFKLFTSDDDGRTFQYVPETDDYHAGVRRPDGVLVAARDHQFDVIGHADYRVEVFHGINYMQIGLDFIVG